MKNLFFKRPIISFLIIYCVYIIIANAAGVFKPERQSTLYYFANKNKPVTIEGKIISRPGITKSGKKFILKSSTIETLPASERILVNMPQGYEASYGDIVSLEGNLKIPQKPVFPLVFDYQSYLAREEIYTILNVTSFEYITSKPNPVKKTALALQQDIINKIDAYFKKPNSDILKPIIIGDKTALDNDIKTAFSDAGVIHVLVVSGLHVGFIGAVFLALFKLCGLPLKKASLLAIPFVFLYALATGANPPAMRAAIMFSCALISLSLDREPLIFNAIALSAVLILLFQPQQLFTASFQMSYAATTGIICFYRPVLRVFGKVKNKILKFFCEVLSITISAQILLIPVIMYYFGKVSIISFIANLIVVPLISVILFSGMIFYFMTFIFSYGAVIFSAAISAVSYFIISSALFFGKLKYASAIVPKPALFQLFLFFVFLFAAGFYKGKKRFIAMSVLLFVNLCYIAVPRYSERKTIFTQIYEGNNVTVLHIRHRKDNWFEIYNSSKYYDRNFINSFKQFLAFSGIKKARITAAGFDEDKIKNDLKDRDITISFR
ncbi:MAG: ComEC family competence protein [Endomicrobia bacterium]|nr:ComEC family competence protein [Endomicrobiia bacterium]MCL2799378.1 ComEC family competence protein [Endomicrobiia bacterium]